MGWLSRIACEFLDGALFGGSLVTRRVSEEPTAIPRSRVGLPNHSIGVKGARTGRILSQKGCEFLEGSFFGGSLKTRRVSEEPIAIPRSRVGLPNHSLGAKGARTGRVLSLSERLQ